MPAAWLLFALLSQVAGGAASQGASISGRVTDKASGQPLPRIVVTLLSADRTNQAVTITDAEGRYAFGGLAAGKYALGADNDDHVATYLRQWFGAEEPADLVGLSPAANIEIGAGEQRANVDLALTRALAIEGHVFDPLGEPVSGVDVSVTNADGRTPGVRMAKTDDLGAYRVYGLRAGQYRVCGAKLGDLSFSPSADAAPLVRTCYPDLALTSQDSFNIDIHMQPGEPPRPTPDATSSPSSTSTDPRTTGTIRGVVVDKQSGRPIPRANVHLVRSESQTPATSTTATNADGVFTFTGLAPGRYDGFANAAGHVLSPLTDRAAGGVLTVQAGETLQISVGLARAYAITVRLADVFGTPISGVGVEAESVDGRSSGFPFDHLMTDDLGRGRLPDLTPGRYRLCADPGYMAPPSPRQPSKRDRLLRTCYPSAPDDAGAQMVTVGNADVDDVEIRMRRGRVLSISGTIFDAAGNPARAVGSLAKYIVNGMTASGFIVGPDGRFQIANAQPGVYAVEATTGREAAFVPVQVVDEDIENLVVVMRSTTSVTGQVIVDDPTTTLPDAPGRAPLVVRTRLSDERLLGGGSSRFTTANSDGTFALKELFGRRMIDVENPPPGWYVKAIRYAGRDVSDTPVEFKDGQQQLEIVLSNHGATLTGTVADVIEKRVARAQVFLLTAPSSKDTPSQLAGWVLSVSGNYRFGPLREGQYFLVAVAADVPMPSPSDWDHLAQLAALGERVTLTDLDQRTIELHVTAVPKWMELEDIFFNIIGSR